MPEFRNVFFTFHYTDVMMASQIRNCDQFFSDRMSFRDWPEWESVRLRSDRAIMDWIDEQLVGTSVTVLLIGDNTHARPWVHYEITESIKRGNGIVPIHINRMCAPRHPGNGPRGMNPLYVHPPRSLSRATGLIASALREYGTKPPTATSSPGLLASALREYGSAKAAQTPSRNALRDLVGLESLGSASPKWWASSSTESVRLGDLLGMGSAAPSRTTGLFAQIPPPPGSALELHGLGTYVRTPAPTLADEVRPYCWVGENGHYNIADWIEKAARDVGR